MKTSLKVVGGKNDGREIAIKVPKFVIGRGEKAHLRSSSDLVSRQHTLIRVRDGKVTIEDLKSRNGTYVNGQKIKGVHVAKPGDKLRVGRLQLEVQIDMAAAGAKRPVVKDVAEVAARTASKSKASDKSLEESITDWLSDDDDSPSISNERKTVASETVQLSLDNTDQIKQPVDADGDENDATVTMKVGEPDSTESESKDRFGKLPSREVEKHESSTHAADDVLKKFFSRR
jgi:pSer/pThr/pTyr-binding forkhead associated (FHA) protein